MDRVLKVRTSELLVVAGDRLGNTIGSFKAHNSYCDWCVCGGRRCCVCCCDLAFGQAAGGQVRQQRNSESLRRGSTRSRSSARPGQHSKSSSSLASDNFESTLNGACVAFEHRPSGELWLLGQGKFGKVGIVQLAHATPVYFV